MRLVKRKERWVLTGSGWALVFAVLLGLIFSFFGCANRFLSVNAPVRAKILVVEGWLPDYALEEAVREFNKNGYNYIVAAGGPMPQGKIISGYISLAEITGATLLKLRIPKEKLVEAPGAMTYRNRTFESAKAVKATLDALGVSVRGINIVSEGPHARRTRLVYRKVFGKSANVGIIMIVSRDYDPKSWWRSSEGLKTTLTEGIGWLFESIFSSGR